MVFSSRFHWFLEMIPPTFSDSSLSCHVPQLPWMTCWSLLISQVLPLFPVMLHGHHLLTFGLILLPNCFPSTGVHWAFSLSLMLPKWNLHCNHCNVWWRLMLILLFLFIYWHVIIGLATGCVISNDFYLLLRLMKTDDSVVIRWFNSTSLSVSSFFLKFTPKNMLNFSIMFVTHTVKYYHWQLHCCTIMSINTYFEQLYCWNHTGRWQTN